MVDITKKDPGSGFHQLVHYETLLYDDTYFVVQVLSRYIVLDKFNLLSEIDH